MAAETGERRSIRTRLLALAAIGVAVAGPAWLLARGVLPLDDAWMAKAGEFTLNLREALGTRGWLAALLDWFINTAVQGLTGVLAATQVVLSLLLLGSALAAFAGDEVGEWSLRRWAWLVLALDGINLALTAGGDASSWLRIALALLLLWLVVPPPWLDPAPAGLGAVATRPATSAPSPGGSGGAA
jgi:hypothetical protein